MRRLSGVLLAGALVMLPAFSHAAFAQAAAPTKTTFTGEVVIQAVAVNPDKTADYESVMSKLKDVLQKSEAPEGKQQAAGWKLIKNSTPNPDGSIVYLHVITPVVPGADYSIINNLYAGIKDPVEQGSVYAAYKGALKQVLFILQGPVALDLSK